MSTINKEDIKRLRDATGVGIMDCKAALAKANGDIEKAKQVLREEGKELLRQSGRQATEGRIEAYLHHSGKIGVLLEVGCNTDFAAKSEDFRQFTRELAMHIAAARPQYLKPDDVPKEAREKEKDIYRKQVEDQGKPPEIVEKIVEGRLKKFYEEACLIKQEFIKDSSHTIEDLLADLSVKIGENIVIKRFSRFEIGE